ncbi:MAG: hypothetical protein JNN30_09580 [Rhodanobacteraceae bacterium]|nr:hypothetical protein [Rhodanobacteraceae bacterium]
MSSKFKVLAAFAAMFFVGHAAHAATVQCVNCSDAQLYNTARTLGASSTAHIVWDPADGDVRRYRNYCGSAPNGTSPGTKSSTTTAAACNLQTEEHQVTSELVGVASAMSQIWRHTGGTFKADITAEIGGISYPSYYPRKPSAHDFQTDLQLQGEILDLASTEDIFGYSTSSLGTALTFIGSHIDAFLSMKQGVFVTIRLKFLDGSSVKVLVKLGEVTTYVKNTARDSSGHVLPDPDYGTPAYPGRWNFAPGQSSDMTQFIEYMRSLGVTITNGQLPNGQVNCVWTSTNNTTTCYIPR